LDIIESTVEDLIIEEATCSNKIFTHKLVGCIIKNGIVKFFYFIFILKFYFLEYLFTINYYYNWNFS